MLHDSAINDTDKTQVNQSIGDFLSCGIPSPKDKVEEIGNEEIGKAKINNLPQHRQDCIHLKPMKLRAKYPRTSKCHDNMNQRKHIGATIHPEFDKFKDFLWHEGPCENKKYTLDRINNDDPEYAPGKVKWRDKHAQNSNKGNNIFLTHEDERIRTIAQWAKITSQNASTLYKRHDNGWTDMEIITGKRTSHISPLDNNPWPYKHKDEWEKDYLDAIADGYNKSKMKFLREKASNILDDCHLKIFKFETAVEYKEANINPDAIPKLHKIHLEYIGYNLDKFMNTPLREMKKQFQHIKELMSRCDRVIKETGEQLIHQEKKKKFLRYNGGGVTANQGLAGFNELFPAPVYTVNKPPVKMI